MDRKWSAFLFFMVAGWVLSFAIFSERSWAQETVKLGAALSLTGEFSRGGRVFKDAYELWRDRVNEKGGINIGGKKYKAEMKFYDDQSSTTTCAKLVEKLIVDDNIKFILGPFSSGITFAASSVNEKYKVPMVEGAGAADTIFQRDYKYVFTVMATASHYFDGLFAMIQKQNLKIKKVAILAMDEQWAIMGAEGAAKQAKKYGIDIVYQAKFPVGVQDLTTELTQIKARGADLLIGTTHLNGTILITKQAKEMRYDFPMIVLVVGPTLPDYYQALKKDAEYVLAPTFWTPDAAYRDNFFGSAQDFAAMIKKRYGYAADYNSAMAAACCMVYQYALEKAGSLDPQKVRDAISSLNLSTFYGPVKFDETGVNVGKSMVYVQIQDGKQVVVWPDEVRTGKLRFPAPPWNKR